MKHKNILVTGSAGLIGYHLSQALLKKGFFVFGLDSLITGQQKNIDLLAQNKNFSFIKMDVCQLKKFDKKLDFIFHFASAASPVDFSKLGIDIALANSMGTLNMLRLAEKNKAKFVFASTSEIYGEPLEHPQAETYFGNVNPVGARSCYDESKRLGEAITTDFIRKNKVKAHILRIFNTYGPNMRLDDGRVVSNFIAQALKGDSLSIYGDGTQTRSMCYVDDLVDIIVQAGLSQKKPNKIYNIGNDDEIKVYDLADMIIGLLGFRSKKAFLPKREDEPSHRRPDLSKVKADFAWQPKIGLEEGLKRTINYFKLCQKK